MTPSARAADRPDVLSYDLWRFASLLLLEFFFSFSLSFSLSLSSVLKRFEKPAQLESARSLESSSLSCYFRFTYEHAGGA